VNWIDLKSLAEGKVDTKMSRKNVLVSVAVIIVVAVVGLWGVEFSAGYQTVSETMSGNYESGQNVNVMGIIKEDTLSISTDRIEFVLHDDENVNDNIYVEYVGNAPTNIVEGQTISLSGTLVDQGKIEADKIVIGCPSRYQT